MDQRIIEFLLRAKKATYAGKGGEIKSSRPGSHDLEYSEGTLHYIDTYLGGMKFAGEEALWQEETPFWAMNYVGRVLSDEFEGDFLKMALSQVPEEMPYRGPKKFANGPFEYRCDVVGDFDWFSGNEEIYINGEKIYECIFHGGLIQ